MGWTTEETRFDSQQGQEISRCFIASRPALGPTQPPIQWVPEDVSLGVKRQGREADHSPLMPRLRMVELYLHCPIRLYGVTLN
jgi:hypothetical protein